MNDYSPGTRAFAAAILSATLALVGCDSNDAVTTESEIERIAILPEDASLVVGERMDFSLAALSAAGDTVRDANLDVRWWSTDTTVFDVQDDGTAIGKDAGTAFCMVEAIELAKTARFTGRDSVTVTVRLF